MRAVTINSPGVQEWRNIVAQIQRTGFTGTFVRDGRIPDASKRIQVRDIKALAPQNEVSRYAEAYRRGDNLPPIIVTRDGYVVDGNTRIAAIRKARRTTIPQFRLDLDYERATDVQKRALLLLGTSMNMTHGRGMNRANVEALIASVWTEGDNAKTIAAKLHCPENTVRRIFVIQNARTRMERLGVEKADTLSPSHLFHFGGWDQKLNDKPYAEMAKLVRDARFSSSETAALGQQLFALATDEEKLHLLATERTANAERINGVTRKPTRAAQLRQALGKILVVEDNPDLAVEEDPSVAPRHLEELRRAHAILGKILSVQYAQESARQDVTAPVVTAPKGWAKFAGR